MRTTYGGVTLTAVAAIATMLHAGAAAADPSQDDQFLAVLQSKQIPALENIPTVVAAGHTVCRKLDDGVPENVILDGLTNDAFEMNPSLRLQSARLSATMSRFISAAVEVYCPGDLNKIAEGTAVRLGPASHSANLITTVTFRRSPSAVAGQVGRPAADPLALSWPIGAVPTADLSQPNPPPPAPAPPQAKAPHSPQVIAKPPPPQRVVPPPPQQPPPPPQQPPPPPEQLEPPPPQQPPPAPEQVDPPANGPGTGTGSGTGGGGGGGGTGSGQGPGAGGSGDGGAAEPSPAQPRPPGLIQLVPW
ncbi:DUF732 domain-containing protein [Mycobacterium sp. UM_Kg1]|uniref:DUF732 domain-containing protein n=1 Tax=Mycobacterium sp. UM_Kg1 TaxID=1545691 RepID=UPI00061AFED4|nr:DUF732 domain-containing protein [Mycobacterium sp. UM_Kg1]